MKTPSRLPEISEQARHRWPGVLVAMGLDERFLRNKAGPCPLCAGRDRYRFDDLEGRGTYYCNVCGPGDGLQLVMRFCGLSFKEAAQRVRELLGTVESRPPPTTSSLKHTRRLLNRIWDEAKPVRHGDEVDRYLGNRGLRMREYPAVLRCHPALPYYENNRVMGTFPAMMAKMLTVQGQPCALHRTYLFDGRKAAVTEPKKILGAIGSSAQIRLFTPSVGGWLCVTEGIETAIAVRLIYGLGYGVWACGNAASLQNFHWPSDVSLIVCGDNDLSCAGQRAAYSLAERAMANGIIARVDIPPEQDSDWADYWAGSQ